MAMQEFGLNIEEFERLQEKSVSTHKMLKEKNNRVPSWCGL